MLYILKCNLIQVGINDIIIFDVYFTTIQSVQAEPPRDQSVQAEPPSDQSVQAEPPRDQSVQAEPPRDQLLNCVWRGKGYGV